MYRVAYYQTETGTQIALTELLPAGTSDAEVIEQAVRAARRRVMLGGGERTLTEQQLRASIVIGSWRD